MLSYFLYFFGGSWVVSCFLYLVSLDHKKIGFSYFVLGIWGGFSGLAFSVLIRVNLVDPYYDLVCPEVHNFVVSYHGLLMIFFFLMPVLIGGFGNYLLPFFLCKSDLLFPRLNGSSLWLMIPSYVLIILSMFWGEGVGWTFYPPLSSSNSLSLGIDLMLLSLHLAGLSSLIGSLNFICSICDKFFNESIFNKSVIIWSYFFTSILLFMSLPVLAACITMVLCDRNFGTSFFDPYGGGDPVLFQHMFWFFGHPEVYVLILPGFGIVSHSSNFLGHGVNVFGYLGLVTAMASIVLLGSVVWVHHMFMVGLDSSTSMFFSSVTMVIGIPTGIKVFSWIFMLRWGKSYLSDPIYWWVTGFVILFTVGGVTGIVLSSSLLDGLFHDTWFVVAHFHYVLSLGSYSALVIGILWWWPIFTGCSLNNTLLWGHWLLSMVGFNLCFFPMHYVGLMGYPRRVSSYDEMIYTSFNISSLGSVMTAMSGFVLFYIIWESLYVQNIVIGVVGLSSSSIECLGVFPVCSHSIYRGGVVYVKVDHGVSSSSSSNENIV